MSSQKIYQLDDVLRIFSASVKLVDSVFSKENVRE